MTESEARLAVADLLRPINAGIGRSTVLVYTFGQFVKKVFFPVFRRKWKTSTAMTDEARIKKHLVGELDRRQMRDITRWELQDVLDKKAPILSGSVVDHLRWDLKSTFRLAMSEGVVERNPADSLVTPKQCKPKKEKRTLTAEDVKLILSVLELRERLIARLATIEGMRPGEILGLHLHDVDDRSLHARRRLYRGNIDDPKNGKPRVVALSSGTVELLNTWKQMLPNHEPEAWVFPSENVSTPLSRDNVWRRNMLPGLSRVGLEWANFQVMRRTNASLGHRAGVDPKVAADQRGHGLGVSVPPQLEMEKAFSR